MKLQRVIRHYTPSKEALRNNEVLINVIQDLYNQCDIFAEFLTNVVSALVRGSNGVYRSIDDIPKIGDGPVNIKVNGKTIVSFTTNEDKETDVNISIPTKLSQLTPDIVLPEKDPIFTKSPAANITDKDIQDWNNKLDEAPVKTVNGLTGDVVITIPSLDGYATETYVDTTVADLVNSAPETLDTLKELAEALGNNPNFATAVAEQIAAKYTKPVGGIPASDLAEGVIPDVPVTSVNGQTGAVQLSIPAPVTESVVSGWGFTKNVGEVISVNGERGEVNLTPIIPSAKVDSTSTSKKFTATVPEIKELKDGTCVLLQNGVVTSDAGFTININNLGAKPVYNSMAANTAETTIFNASYTMLFVFDANRISGGCWICYRGYDSNTNTIGYQLRTNSYTLPAADKTYRFRLLFTSADGSKFVPANTSTSKDATSRRTPNTRAINPFGQIVYYNYDGTTNANANFRTTNLWTQITLTLGYSFNNTGDELTLIHPAPVYIKCTPNADGSATINAAEPYVQALPTTDDGFIYIHLGFAYSDTDIELIPEHKVYYYKNGEIRLWHGKEATSSASPIPFVVTNADDCANPVIIQQWQAMWDEIDEAVADAGISDYVNVYKYFNFVRGGYINGYTGGVRIITDITIDHNNRCLRYNNDYYLHYNENTGIIEEVYDD